MSSRGVAQRPALRLFSATNLYVASVIAAGCAVSALILVYGNVLSAKDGVVFAAAIVSAGWKIRVPGITSTCSLSFASTMIGMVEDCSPYACLSAGMAAAVQSVFRAASKPRPEQVAFNFAAIVLSSWTAFVAFRLVGSSTSTWVAALAATATLYLVNSLLVAIVLVLSDPAVTPAAVARWCVSLAPTYAIVGAIACLCDLVF
jgi:hypothetical protein